MKLAFDVSLFVSRLICCIVTITRSGRHIVDIYISGVDEGIEIVDVRHEKVAAHAADAYAHINGLGCAAVTAGPDTTDAVTGVANASCAESATLLIGGNSPLKQYRMGGLQELRHSEMISPISKFVSLVMTTDCVAIRRRERHSVV